MALRFCAALREFWVVRGLYSEGRAFLEQALAAVRRSFDFRASKGVERCRCLRRLAGRLIIVQEALLQEVSSCTASLETREALLPPSRGWHGSPRGKETKSLHVSCWKRA